MRRLGLRVVLPVVMVVGAVIGLSRLAPTPVTEGAMDACRLADGQAASGLIDEADKGLRAVLAERSIDPAAQSCAQQGLATLAHIRCVIGDRDREVGAIAAARTQYDAVIADATAGTAALACAVAGLNLLPTVPAVPGSLSVLPLPATTLSAVGRPRFVDRVVAGARRIARWPPSELAGHSVDVGPVEWLALLVVLLLVYRWWIRWIGRSDIGTVDVAPIEVDTGISASPDQLAALIRDRLARNGLLPSPGAPGGNLSSGFVDVVSSSPVPDANWFGSAFKLVMSLASTACDHRLVATARKRERTQARRQDCGLTVQLVDVSTGRATLVRTFWDVTYEGAAAQAADVAYAAVVRQPDERCTPTWKRWTGLDGCAIAKFQEGIDFELGDDVSAALASYGEAALLEPRNLMIRLRIGSLYEVQGHWAEALRVYLEAVRDWPRVYEARYRLAITLGFPLLVITDLEKQDGDTQNEIFALLAARGGTWWAAPTAADIGTGDFVPKLVAGATAELRQLRKDVRWLRTVMRWVSTAFPPESLVREHHLFAELAVPWNRTRRLRVNVMALSAACLELQVAVSTRRLRLERDVKERLRWFRAKSWQVRYNAACCASRLIPKVPISARPSWIELAIEQLDLAYHDPDGQLSLAWVDLDPDLAALRETADFVDGWRPRHRDAPVHAR